MDFSRPDNARKINRIKVLNALRAGNMSRAELSRELLINKVSISDITESLIKDGLIVEMEKEMTTGRPATKLSINRNAGRVFSIELRKASVSVSISDTLGRVLRFERMPRSENLWQDIRAICDRLGKDAKIFGAAVVSHEDVEIDLPWPSILICPAIAEARAEIDYVTASLDGFYFVSWNETIEAAYLKNQLFDIKSFAHIRVAKSGKCSCGAEGCLEAVASGERLRETTGLRSLREIALNDDFVRDPSRAMVFALSQAVQATGARSVMLTGELSALSDQIYADMQTKLTSYLPAERKDVIIFRSNCKEGGLSIGASILALDNFFYSSNILEALQKLESSSLHPLT